MQNSARVRQVSQLSLFAGSVVLFALFLTACPNPVVPSHPTTTTTNPLISISAKPNVALPAGLTGTVTIGTSNVAVPQTINTHFRAIGQAYDIGIAGRTGPISFGANYAVLTYSFDSSKLRSNGLLNEFMVFYFDVPTSTWKRVDKLEVDYTNSLIKAYTSHFTTFVTTATLVQPDAIPQPPTGINADYPDGIGGSGHSVFTVIGQGYQYYQDRAYYLKPLSISAVNQATFAALGFDGAMGISTMNGGTVADPYTAHKLYTGNDYITLVAKRDLDVYLMYDTRGGTGPTDNSADAPWLASYGFTTNISTPTVPTPTRYFLETTDAVGQYKVYKNTYLAGSTIHLDGNVKGVTDPGIQTNYWVILKCKDVYVNEPASSLIVSPVDVTPPAEVAGLTASGGDSGVHLSWTPPPDADFKQVVISYSPGGITPFILAKGTNSADISGLSNGTLYTFTVKTVDTSLNISNGVTAQATPNQLLSVIYYGNGQTSGNVPVDSANYANGQTITIKDNTGNLAKTGYTFTGWNTQPNGGGTAYSPGQTTSMGLTNVQLYANWLINPTTVAVNVSLDVGSSSTITMTVPGTVVRGNLLNVSVAEAFDSYQWYLDTNATVLGTSQMLSLDTSSLSPGLHTLMALVAKNGIYSSSSCQFTVGNPTGLSVNVSLNVGSDATITTTVPSTVIRGSQLNVSVAESFDTYQWYLDDSQTMVGTTQTVAIATTNLSAGLHTLALVVAKNGVYSSANCNFTVGNPTGFTVSVSLTVGSEDTVSVSVPLTVAKGSLVNISVAQTFDTYQWYLDDSQTIVATTQTAAINTTSVSPGLHSLMLLVSKNGSFTSSNYRFTVTN